MVLFKHLFPYLEARGRSLAKRKNSRSWVFWPTLNECDMVQNWWQRLAGGDGDSKRRGTVLVYLARIQEVSLFHSILYKHSHYGEVPDSTALGWLRKRKQLWKHIVKRGISERRAKVLPRFFCVPGFAPCCSLNMDYHWTCGPGEASAVSYAQQISWDTEYKKDLSAVQLTMWQPTHCICLRGSCKKGDFEPERYHSG